MTNKKNNTRSRHWIPAKSLALALALAPSLPERLPPNDYYVPFFFFNPKRETPALLCPTPARTQKASASRSNSPEMRRVHCRLATQAPWNLRKRKEMACRLAAYMHRDAGWSVPVGLGCDLTECECQALPSSAPWRRDQHPGAFAFASGGPFPFRRRQAG